MEMDPQACFKRNIHNRSLQDIEAIVSSFFPTPAHHIQLDPTTLLQSASIREVQMEDADDVTMEEVENPEVRYGFAMGFAKRFALGLAIVCNGLQWDLQPLKDSII